MMRVDDESSKHLIASRQRSNVDTAESKEESKYEFKTQKDQVGFFNFLLPSQNYKLWCFASA
jgi:hypothetical protein